MPDTAAFPWIDDRPATPAAAVRSLSLAKVVRDDILGLILRGEHVCHADVYS